MTNSIKVKKMENSIITSLFSFDITPYLKRVEYKKGESIFNGGEEIERLVYIEKGSVLCSSINEEGEITALDLVTIPTIFGELELLDIQKYTIFVTSLTSCSGYLIETKKIKEKLLSDSVFLIFLLKQSAAKVYRINNRAAINHTYSLKRRLINYILDREENGLYKENHTLCSQFLSTSYRHLLLLFSTLEKEGYIKREERGVYRIINREKMERERID